MKISDLKIQMSELSTIQTELVIFAALITNYNQNHMSKCNFELDQEHQDKNSIVTLKIRVYI